MKFSVITPSFRQHDWLRLCAASVADQAGVELEHLVQDGGGPDVQAAIATWAQDNPRLRLVVEPDKGMYDAINRGLRRATGDICCYLNCDEQYLPGALGKVAEHFARFPETEVLFADAFVVDGEGRYLFHRQTLVPSLHHTVACHLGTLTCATFFRRSLVQRGFVFDPSYRAVGDAEWMTRLLESGVQMAHMPALVSAFSDLGSNLGFSERSLAEQRRLQERYPRSWVRCRLVWSVQHRLRRLLAGYYWPPATEYAIYTLAQPGHRTSFAMQSPRGSWRRSAG